MQIEFTLDDTVAEFRRNWFMGRAELRIDGKVELLQNPLNPGTHFQLSLTRRWLLFNVNYISRPSTTIRIPVPLNRVLAAPRGRKNTLNIGFPPWIFL